MTFPVFFCVFVVSTVVVFSTAHWFRKTKKEVPSIVQWLIFGYFALYHVALFWGSYYIFHDLLGWA